PPLYLRLPLLPPGPRRPRRRFFYLNEPIQAGRSPHSAREPRGGGRRGLPRDYRRAACPRLVRRVLLHRPGSSVLLPDCQTANLLSIGRPRRSHARGPRPLCQRRVSRTRPRGDGEDGRLPRSHLGHRRRGEPDGRVFDRRAIILIIAPWSACFGKDNKTLPLS